MAYKIIFFGSSEFGIPIINELGKNSDFEIMAIVTQPDKPVGRGQKTTPTPIKAFYESRYPILTPEKVKNNKDFEKIIEGLAPDFIITAAYGQIMPPSILNLAKIAPINIHTSLLPKYRGASPIQEAILNGDKETGVTIMEMNDKLDEGDIYIIRRIPIEEKDNVETLNKKLAILASQMLPPSLLDIADGILKKIPQNNVIASYCGKIAKESGKINFKQMTAEEILRKIRAFYGWPECWTQFNGKTLKIKDAEIAEDKEKTPPGKIIFIDKNTIGIGTKSRLLIPKTIQMEGKNEIPIKDFINGQRKLLTISQEL
ncbi:MAG: methionyl-tRNA formyltransferase [Candidatus Gracilibacteria bacterium]|jgi:methionyl-tRNA formyltransferase